MQTRVQKWGNSLAVRIPRPFADEIGIADNSEVDLSLDKGMLVVRPVQRIRYDLIDLLAKVSKSNLHPEVDTGPSVGNESW